MPLYEYVCEEHGVFDDWKDFARCAEPASCPHCGALSTKLPSHHGATPQLSMATITKSGATAGDRSLPRALSQRAPIDLDASRWELGRADDRSTGSRTRQAQHN